MSSFASVIPSFEMSRKTWKRREKKALLFPGQKQGVDLKGPKKRLMIRRAKGRKTEMIGLYFN